MLTTVGAYAIGAILALIGLGLLALLVLAARMNDDYYLEDDEEADDDEEEENFVDLDECLGGDSDVS